MYYSSSIDVQWAQRVASMGISLLQKGQTLVVGSAEGSSFFLPIDIRVFIAFISKNSTSAIIKKLIIAEINAER